MKEEYQHVNHGFGPIIFPDSEILILGSMPSVKSRKAQFYYMHPQNRFWDVLSILFSYPFKDISVEDKILGLKKNHIALFDAIAECDIVGSSDLKIKNIKVNSIPELIKSTQIKSIYCNGSKSFSIIEKYYPELNAICLPSTSPANATYNLNKLVDKWNVIKQEK